MTSYDEVLYVPLLYHIIIISLCCCLGQKVCHFYRPLDRRLHIVMAWLPNHRMEEVDANTWLQYLRKSDESLNSKMQSLSSTITSFITTRSPATNLTIPGTVVSAS